MRLLIRASESEFPPLGGRARPQRRSEGVRCPEGTRSRATAPSKGGSRGGSGSWSGCLLGAFLWHFSGHIQLVGDCSADPEQDGRITYHIWPGNASGPSYPPREELENVAVEGDVSKTQLSLLPPQPCPGKATGNRRADPLNHHLTLSVSVLFMQLIALFPLIAFLL
ncbi:hypothetical protein L3Q82_006598 [Scortum barcoo]|uniref:Uncharacterized protein n=1 Tax=Scortum barcoo TaxID=214431 RepID=A0ACB8X0L2_9TELE|nr:hypothetical protein L3Q82_006598 [Scortum barcoo]